MLKGQARAGGRRRRATAAGEGLDDRRTLAHSPTGCTRRGNRNHKPLRRMWRRSPIRVQPEASHAAGPPVAASGGAAGNHAAGGSCSAPRPCEPEPVRPLAPPITRQAFSPGETRCARVASRAFQNQTRTNSARWTHARIDESGAAPLLLGFACDSALLVVTTAGWISLAPDPPMSSYADLEEGLYRRGDGGYAVELRLTLQGDPPCFGAQSSEFSHLIRGCVSWHVAGRPIRPPGAELAGRRRPEGSRPASPMRPRTCH